MSDLQTTNNQPLTLGQKLTAATDKLRPASEDAIASAIIKLAGAGLAFPGGLRSEGAARVYQFALRGVSVEGLKRTITKIVQGEIPSVREFLPAPPALAALVKIEERELWADRERLLLTAESIKAAQEGREPASDESKARVRAMVQQVKINADAIREAQRNTLYDKPEDELNRMFKNKVDPPAEPPPSAGKWSDQAWFEQQKENENGKEDFGSQRDVEALPSGDADGSGDRDQGGGLPFGFEEGGV